MLTRIHRPFFEAEEPLVVCPTKPTYKLPIAIIDPHGFTENDASLVQAMASYAPQCRFQAGDLVMLTEVPGHLLRRGAVLPRIWKIRFIVTRYAYELMQIAWQHGGNIGMDRGISLLERHRVDSSEYRKPVIFAHGYPHGMWPGTATWLPVRVLMRAPFREDNVQWRQIVESAGADFLGYDPERAQASIGFPVAPDDYSMGQNIGKPFDHEENVTHAACLSGLEEAMMVPIRIDGSKGSASEALKERMEPAGEED